MPVDRHPLAGSHPLVGGHPLAGSHALVGVQEEAAAVLTLDSIADQPNETARALVHVGDLRANGSNVLLFSTRAGQETGSLTTAAGTSFLEAELRVDRIQWNPDLKRIIFNKAGTENFTGNVLTGQHFLFFDHTSSTPQARIVVGTTPTVVSTGFFNATFGLQSTDAAFFDGLEEGDRFIVVWASA